MITIRQAQVSDAAVLAELGRTTFSATFAADNRPEDMDLYLAATFAEEIQRAELGNPQRRIDIAWAHEQAIGYVHLLRGTLHPAVRGSRPLEILRLYVAAGWHSKGVGAALMERALHVARAEGYTTLWLGVWERNFRAQAFYARYGFSRVGEHVFQLGHDAQLDFILARSV